MPQIDKQSMFIEGSLTINGGEALPDYQGVIDDKTKEFTIDDYIQAAMESQHLSSKRALCQALGVSHNVVSTWENGIAWPSDEKMRILARLADGDIDEALLRLNMWRSKSPETASFYRHMLNGIYRLKGSDYCPSLYKLPAILAFIIGLSIPGTGQGQSNLAAVDTVYYGKSNIIF